MEVRARVRGHLPTHLFCLFRLCLHSTLHLALPFSDDLTSDIQYLSSARRPAPSTAFQPSWRPSDSFEPPAWIGLDVSYDGSKCLPDGIVRSYSKETRPHIVVKDLPVRAHPCVLPTPTQGQRSAQASPYSFKLILATALLKSDMSDDPVNVATQEGTIPFVLGDVTFSTWYKLAGTLAGRSSSCTAD
jgi:hypothetical protein